MELHADSGAGNRDLRLRSPNFQPLRFVADIADDARALLENRAFLQVAFNVVFFMPLGVVVRVLARRGSAVATGVGLLTSVAIETTQFTGVWGTFTCAYRSFDGDDLLLNTFGALLGSLIALPIVRLIRRQRGQVSVQQVTIGRRLAGMLVDALAMTLVGFVCTVGWRAFAVYLLGWPVYDLPNWLNQTVSLGSAAVLQAYWVLVRGQTVGEDVVMLQPVPAPGREPLSAVIKYCVGVGGYLVLASDLSPNNWPLLGFLALTIGWAIWSPNHRGLSHTLAGMELRIEPPPSVLPNLHDDAPPASA